MSYQPTKEDYEWAERVGRSCALRANLRGFGDDGAQEGCIAVWLGARRFNAKRGVPFRAFVIRRIQGRVQDLIRKEVGRGGSKLAERNALSIGENDEAKGGGGRNLQIDDGSRPVLDLTIRHEFVAKLYAACRTERERLLLGAWSDLWTQRDIADQAHVTESAVSCQSVRLRARLREEFGRLEIPR